MSSGSESKEQLIEHQSQSPPSPKVQVNVQATVSEAKSVDGQVQQSTTTFVGSHGSVDFLEAAVAQICAHHNETCVFKPRLQFSDAAREKIALAADIQKPNTYASVASQTCKKSCVTLIHSCDQFGNDPEPAFLIMIQYVPCVDFVDLMI